MIICITLENPIILAFRILIFLFHKDNVSIREGEMLDVGRHHSLEVSQKTFQQKQCKVLFSKELHTKVSAFQIQNPLRTCPTKQMDRLEHVFHTMLCIMHNALNQKWATTTQQLPHVQRKFIVQKLGVRMHININAAHPKLWIWLTLSRQVMHGTTRDARGIPRKGILWDWQNQSSVNCVSILQGTIFHNQGSDNPIETFHKFMNLKKGYW